MARHTHVCPWPASHCLDLIGPWHAVYWDSGGSIVSFFNVSFFFFNAVPSFLPVPCPVCPRSYVALALRCKAVCLSDSLSVCLSVSQSVCHGPASSCKVADICTSPQKKPDARGYQCPRRRGARASREATLSLPWTPEASPMATRICQQSESWFPTRFIWNLQRQWSRSEFRNRLLVGRTLAWKNHHEPLEKPAHRHDNRIV